MIINAFYIKTYLLCLTHFTIRIIANKFIQFDRFYFEKISDDKVNNKFLLFLQTSSKKISFCKKIFPYKKTFINEKK